MLVFFSSVPAAEPSETIVIHAGELLAVPGESPRQRQSIIIRAGRVEEIRELPAGYEFALRAETSTILAAAEFISLERQCCPFLKFELDLHPDTSSHY